MKVSTATAISSALLIPHYTPSNDTPFCTVEDRKRRRFDTIKSALFRYRELKGHARVPKGTITLHFLHLHCLFCFVTSSL